MSGELSDPLEFDPFEEQGRGGVLQVSPDGSVWLLSYTGGYDDPAAGPQLLRYSPTGELLGSTGVVQAAEGKHLETSLGFDGDGNAIVAVYWSWAETAGTEVIERLNLYAYAPDLTLHGEIQSFRGAANVVVSGNGSSDVWIAGNADRLDEHGVLARLVGGQVEWIQTAVVTGGRTAGVGVSGLTVDADGRAVVAAQLGRRSDHPSAGAAFGLATFDASGQPGWAIQLPTAYEPGGRLGLLGLPDGDLLVGGAVGGRSEGLTTSIPIFVRRVTSTGRLSWGYRIETLGQAISMAVMGDGRVVTASKAGVAVISADGQSCRDLAIPAVQDGSLHYHDHIAASGDLVYVSTGQGVVAYRLPEE